MTTGEDGIKVNLSLERKVNLGNYESGGVFISISNVPVGATEEEIAAAMDTGQIVFDVLRVAVNDKAKKLREGGR